MKKILALMCVAALSLGAAAGEKVNMQAVGFGSTEASVSQDNGSMLIAKAPKKHHKCCKNCKKDKNCKCKKGSKNCSKNCRACRHNRHNNTPYRTSHGGNLNPSVGNHHGDPQPGNHHGNPQPGGHNGDPQPGGHHGDPQPGGHHGNPQPGGHNGDRPRI